MKFTSIVLAVLVYTSSALAIDWPAAPSPREGHTPREHSRDIGARDRHVPRGYTRDQRASYELSK
ncbi:hypothetical protein BDZ94DRAFT_1264637 [Collybia nuda]|uniref:Uncharacterized protein n=1 Tax=Collybia nuda TaxID=64659 RepID=A0A9P6CG88_9AGAR|nr:hypothetical protein BDZ94DRAFT_1264637 [Collybia nuda]